MNKRILLLLSLFIMIVSSSAYSGDIQEWKQKLNVPNWVNNLFREKLLKDRFNYLFEMNPFYLRGDFNGDNQSDIAIWVKEKSSNKVGFLIIHYESKNVFVVGAGSNIGNGGDNFDWLTNWAVKRKNRVSQGGNEGSPPVLSGEAIYVEKAESASAIIYWDRNLYKWYQQGD